MNKATKTILTISNSIIIAGIMVLLYGLYFLLAKGGVLLPFHDAPEDILWIYKINTDIAKTIIGLGIIVLLSGIIFQIVRYTVDKNKEIQTKEYKVIDVMTNVFLGSTIAAVAIMLKGFFFLAYQLDPQGNLNSGDRYAKNMWSLLTTRFFVVFVILAIISSFLIIKNKNRSNLLALILLFPLWSVVCFAAFFWLYNYVGSFWARYDYMYDIPIRIKRLSFFLEAMQVIWIAVPVIVGIVVYLRKHSRKKADSHEAEESENQQ